MKCTACSTDNAYVGANVVECVSSTCRHFSQRQRDEMNQMRRTDRDLVWTYIDFKEDPFWKQYQILNKALEEGSYDAAPGVLKQGSELSLVDLEDAYSNPAHWTYRTITLPRMARNIVVDPDFFKQKKVLYNDGL